jgi:hypothetical protein
MPSGFASDSFSQEHFNYLHGAGRLVSFFDFENRLGIFPGVHRSYKFCLATIAGTGVKGRPTDFLFFGQRAEDLRDSARHVPLSEEDLVLLNPLTKTAPLFRCARDKQLTVRLHEPGRMIGHCNDQSDWQIRVMLMFMMNAEMKEHRSAEELDQQGYQLEGNTYRKGTDTWLPLYEGKMVGMFDHRAASIEFDPNNRVRRNQPSELSSQAHRDPSQLAQPLFWVSTESISERCSQALRWNLAVKDVTASTNERTAIAAILPPAALTDSVPRLSSAHPASTVSCLLANVNAFALDFTARQKVAGLHLRGHYLAQLPIIGLQKFTAESPWDRSMSVEHFVLPRVLELTYTAWDLEAFAQDCRYDGPPFRWDEERRFLLRCELDAAFFHLYGINRDDAAYIMDTFPIVKRKDEAKWGTYRTKDTILEIYAALAESQRTGQPYATRLNPAPASIQVAHAPRFDRERVGLEVGDYIPGFVFSMLRYAGGTCDLMRLVRGYALLQQPKVLAALVEPQFDAAGRKWVEQSSQPQDGRWFLPILRRMETHDMVSFEVRGDDVMVHQKDPQGPRIDAAVATDAFLVMRVLDAVPDQAIAEPVKRIVPKAPRVALQEATIPA